jgi:mutator protein MutT
LPEPETIRVIAAVIERDGRWLVGRRPPEKRHGGLWEFPGGKVDPGESAMHAARRELAEELGLIATGVGAVLHTVRDGDSPFVIDFVEVTAHGSAAPLEHTEVGWFDLAGLGELPLAPADRAFARWLTSSREGGW